MSKSALIAGSTGLIGSALLQLLLEENHYEHVISISRRSTGVNHPKLKEVITSFDRLSNVKEDLIADDVFICLGSTMKKAGSKDAFEKYDYAYPLEIATIALENGAQQVSIITALGANSESPFFYNRVKGDLEKAMASLDYKSVNMLRPSLLLGERDENRMTENIAQSFYKALGWAFVGPISKYKAVEGSSVARAMLQVAKENKNGVNIFDSNTIKQKAQI